MSLIYVFAASKSEARPALDFAQQRRRQREQALVDSARSQSHLAVVITGMGRQNAAARASDVLTSSISQLDERITGSQPSAVLVIGVCGGLTSSVPEGRIVIYDQCLSAGDQQPALSCSALVTTAILETLRSHGIPCASVTGITSSQIAATKTSRIELAKSGADAVDMESYDILSVAAHANIPAAVLRAASDSVNTVMPNFDLAINAGGSINSFKALPIALRSPIRTLRLMITHHRAMRALAPALKLVLQSDLFREAISD